VASCLIRIIIVIAGVKKSQADYAMSYFGVTGRKESHVTTLTPITSGLSDTRSP
jgi:hypothetical protein